MLVVDADCSKPRKGATNSDFYHVSAILSRVNRGDKKTVLGKAV